MTPFSDETDDSAGFLILLGLIVLALIFAGIHYHLNKPIKRKR